MKSPRAPALGDFFVHALRRPHGILELFAVSLMPLPYGRGLPTFVKTMLANLQTDFGNVVKLSCK